MAESVVINIEANTKGLESVIDLLVRVGAVEKQAAEDFKRYNESKIKSIEGAATETIKQYERVSNATKSIKQDNALAKSLDASASVLKTSNSLTQLKKELQAAKAEADKLVQEFGKNAPESILAQAKVGDLKKSVAAAKEELALMRQLFGDNSQQATEAAQKVADLSRSLLTAEDAAEQTVEKFGKLNPTAAAALTNVAKLTDEFEAAKQAVIETAEAERILAAEAKANAEKEKQSIREQSKLEKEQVEEAKRLAKERIDAENKARQEAENSIRSLSQQLKEARVEAQILADQFGLDSVQAKEAAANASRLAKEIDDVNKRINALNPEAKFALINRLGNSLIGVFQVATGALQAFGVESEQATKLAQQFQGALNITVGLTQLSQLKDVVGDIRAAFGLSETAAKGAAAATKGFGTALTIGAIGAITLAIYGISKAFEAVEEDAKAAEERLKSLRDLTKDLNDGTVKISDSLLRYKVATGEITQAEAERITLQRKSAQDQDEINKKILAVQEEQKKNLAEISKLEQLATAARSSNREGAALNLATYQKDIENLQNRNKTLIVLEQGYKAQRLQIDRDYRLQFEANQAEEERAVKDKNDAIVEDAKETSEELKGVDYSVIDSQQFAAASGLINQYYDQLIASASQSATSIEQLRELETSNDLKRLDELIAAGIAFNQDVSQLVKRRSEIELSEQDRRLKEAEKVFNEFLKTPAGRYFFGGGLPVTDNQVDDKTLQQIESIKDAIIDTFTGGAISAFFADISNGLAEQAELVNEYRDEQLAAIEEEEQALLDSYDRREIGKRELEQQNKQLALDRVAAEKKAESELNAIKRKQDIANRAQKIFEIGIATARNAVEQPGVAGTLIPFWVGLGAIQTAAVLAQPLPKYKKGTLSVGGTGTEDSQLALLQPGEAVIPTDTNKKYHPAIKAIYHGKIKPDVINEFVNLKLKGGSTVKETTKESIDLYALARIIRKNNNVNISNWGELAKFIQSDNIRRS